MIECKGDEVEHQGVCVKVDDRFMGLMREIPDQIFWKWVSGWKDPDAIVREAQAWDTNTKKETIWEIESQIEEQTNEKGLRDELRRNQALYDLSSSTHSRRRVLRDAERWEKEGW